MSLLVCTPMYGGQCHAGYFRGCMALKEEFLRIGLAHDWCVTINESLITRARDTSVARFRKTEYERLLFIDADIEFQPTDVAALWNMDSDIAVAAYAMKRPDNPLAAWKDGALLKITDDMKAPFAVDYAGTGFMMVKRNVFDKLEAAHPEWVYEESQVGAGCVGFFQDPIEDGIHLSEDYFFCKRWRELGGAVMLDPTIRLTHWGSFGFGG